MAETIGSRLKAARESKGMSIDDVAFETRIRGSYLKCLEADDYSQFASTTYAKSFLTLYSRFLEVEVDEAMHFFKGRDEIHLSGKASYLAAVQPIESVSAPKVTRTTETDEDGATVVVERERPGVAPIFLGVIVVLLISAIPILWWIGREATSIDEATDKAKELVENANQAVNAVGNAAKGGETSPAGTESGEFERPKLALESREVAASWLIESSEPKPKPAPTPPSTENATSPGPSVAATPESSTLDQATPSIPSPSEQSITTPVPTPGERPRFGTPSGSTPLPSAFPADLPPKPLPADAPPGALALKAGTLLPLPGNRSAEATEETPTPDTPPSNPAPLVAQETGTPSSPGSDANSSNPKPKPEVDPEPEPTPSDPAPEPEPEPEPTPAPASPGPLRAVPLVAQPVVLPEVDVPSDEGEEEDETEDEGSESETDDDE